MDAVRSREALFRFIDWTGEKGLMGEHTVRGRKAAAGQMLAILDDAEAADVTNIDLDDLADRFHRKNMQKYSPSSIAAYKSRLRATIDDFVTYLQSPTTFRPSNIGRAKPSTRSKTAKAFPPQPAERLQREMPHQRVMPPATVNVVPIPIRADLTVYVQGLPFDLTPGEARKIAAVISAMATADEST